MRLLDLEAKKNLTHMTFEHRPNKIGKIKKLVVLFGSGLSRDSVFASCFHFRGNSFPGSHPLSLIMFGCSRVSSWKFLCETKGG